VANGIANAKDAPFMVGIYLFYLFRLHVPLKDESIRCSFQMKIYLILILSGPNEKYLALKTRSDVKIG
jgi:hypothetical protein